MEYPKIIKHLQGEPLDRETADEYLQLIYDSCRSTTAHILSTAFMEAARLLRDGWQDKSEEEQATITKEAFSILSESVRFQLENLALGAMKLGETFAQEGLSVDIKLPGTNTWMSDVKDQVINSLGGKKGPRDPSNLN